MYRCIIDIAIKQAPSPKFPKRTKVARFDFANTVEAKDNWEDFTNTAKIIIPRNFYYIDADLLKPKRVPYGQTGGSTNSNIGGLINDEPLFLRGDTVEISYGYKYIDKAGKHITDLAKIFTGYISEVKNSTPVELKCEDNMWLLKLTPALPGYWKGYTIENMLRKMIAAAGLPFTVNDVTETKTPAQNILTNKSQSICDVLLELKNRFHFSAYFRGNELRCGSFVYLPSDAQKKEPIFHYQKNIISDELIFQRTDDMNFSCTATSIITEETGAFTKDGYAKTKQRRLSVFMTLKHGQEKPTVHELKPGEKPPENISGIRTSYQYIGITSIKKLVELATNDLRKAYYTGMKGKFTTFAIPFVRMGDNVVLINGIYPEANGRYKVRSVEYSATMAGYRQEIELHYLIERLDAAGKAVPL